MGAFGEYFLGETHWNHAETSLGGLLSVPRHGEVLTTVFDPLSNVPTSNEPTQFYDQGVVELNHLGPNAGNRTRAYRAYDGLPPNINLPTFAKANGLGELAALCEAHFLEVGNRVWCDDNSNSVQDLECDVNGDGFGGPDDFSATTMTAGGGFYRFNVSNFDVPRGIPTTTTCRVLIHVSSGGPNFTPLDAACSTSPEVDHRGACVDVEADGQPFGSITWLAPPLAMRGQ